MQVLHILPKNTKNKITKSQIEQFTIVIHEILSDMLLPKLMSKEVRVKYLGL